MAEQLLDTSSSGTADPFTTALAAGEPAALRLAYRQHHEIVRAFARRLLGSPADAEELVQDTFVSLPGAMRRFRGQCALRTFVLSIAATRSRNVLRSRRRRSRAEESWREAPPPVDPGAQPDDALARRRLLERLQRALDVLTPDQRVAFVLAEVEERSSLELSQILGAPASTIRARVAAAKERLRIELSGLEAKERS